MQNSNTGIVKNWKCTGIHLKLGNLCVCVCGGGGGAFTPGLLLEYSGFSWKAWEISGCAAMLQQNICIMI